MTVVMDECPPTCVSVGPPWVAARIGVSTRTVTRWAQQNLIPGRMELFSPRVIRFDRARVEQWIKGLAK